MSAPPEFPPKPVQRSKREQMEWNLRRRPLRDLFLISGSLLFAILSVSIVGFHPGIIALSAGIGIAAIPRFVWIERKVAPFVIGRRYILCMILVGVLCSVASAAELVVIRPAAPQPAETTFLTGMLFAVMGGYGYWAFGQNRGD